MRPDVFRVDGSNANASAGRVRLDPVKAAWNGGMILCSLVFAPLTVNTGALLVFGVLTWVTLLLGHSVGMHRRLIHRSFDCAKPLERSLVYLGVLVGMAGPFGVLRIHDLRDWAQREPECHDFFSHRRALWLDAIWQLGARFEFAQAPTFRIEDEVAHDPWYRWLERTWMLQQVPLAALLYACGGWSWVVWGIFVRVGISVVGHWVVTYYTHQLGGGRWHVRGAGVQASNLRGLGWLTMGECWHNNHHAFPESACIGLSKGEVDPGYWVIRKLAQFGWVSRIGLPRVDAERDDLLEARATAVQVSPRHPLDQSLPDLRQHRVQGTQASVSVGEVRFAPQKSVWLTTMFLGAVIGGALTISWAAVTVFAALTAIVLLFGHSLGSHRKLIHNSYDCPRWLDYTLVYLGVQVGLAGPLGLLGQHELRDFAQRLPNCHPFLRHGSPFWRDAWWQLHCELQLANPPQLRIEERVAQDRFYRFLERTWMLQHLPPALVLYAAGGWAFVFWGCCARVTAGVIGHWLIGYFAHNKGQQHFVVRGAAVQGHNIPFMSLLTMGECWHNNHHAYPGSAKLGLMPGEWDPGWWVLLVLKRLGIVWNMTLPEHLPARTELICLNQHSSSREGEVEPPDLRRLVNACLAAARGADCQPALLTGPAATVHPDLFRLLAPRAVRFERRQQRRLRLLTQDGNYQGLPAMCVAMAAGGRGAALLAIAVAPAAVVFERARCRLSSATL